ncbi:large ribosomal subunit protein bL33m [Halyomorpha halys]|uniref:large ribosomal subunit protein bL33m n=1 Tax=Halyomorpha halys TaxID=286706 RepID=UPI0006D4D314|nr:39S ribosomal protein L33, mitochondrial [Halyomorpha halys]
MFLTQVLLKKKTKSKFILVLIQSLVSGHNRTWVRERLGDKLELTLFDPYIQQESVYKELKKIKSLKV